MKKIKYVEQRGKSRVLLAAKNKQDIIDWFIEHPGGTQKECGIALKLSRLTVSKHFRTLLV